LPFGLINKVEETTNEETLNKIVVYRKKIICKMPIKSIKEVTKYSLNYTKNLRRYLRGDFWIKVVCVIDFYKVKRRFNYE